MCRRARQTRREEGKSSPRVHVSALASRCDYSRSALSSGRTNGHGMSSPRAHSYATRLPPAKAKLRRLVRSRMYEARRYYNARERAYTRTEKIFPFSFYRGVTITQLFAHTVERSGLSLEFREFRYFREIDLPENRSRFKKHRKHTDTHRL